MKFDSTTNTYIVFILLNLVFGFMSLGSFWCLINFACAGWMAHSLWKYKKGR